MYHFAFFFLTLVFFSFCMMLISAATPQGAWFLPDKTRLKGVFMWLLVSVFSIIMIGILNHVRFPE